MASLESVNGEHVSAMIKCSSSLVHFEFDRYPPQQGKHGTNKSSKDKRMSDLTNFAVLGAKSAKAR